MRGSGNLEHRHYDRESLHDRRPAASGRAPGQAGAGAGTHFSVAGSAGKLYSLSDAFCKASFVSALRIGLFGLPKAYVPSRMGPWN
ncbi:hypothetical protein TRIP_E280146 [uncultured Spirochaetota bacterium]|nr:hypothetical protein TRIP_E280146 [uncultured Spirochaetota bacterium]